MHLAIMNRFSAKQIDHIALQPTTPRADGRRETRALVSNGALDGMFAGTNKSLVASYSTDAMGLPFGGVGADVMEVRSAMFAGDVFGDRCAGCCNNLLNVGVK